MKEILDLLIRHFGKEPSWLPDTNYERHLVRSELLFPAITHRLCFRPLGLKFPLFCVDPLVLLSFPVCVYGRPLLQCGYRIWTQHRTICEPRALDTAWFHFFVPRKSAMNVIQVFRLNPSNSFDIN